MADSEASTSAGLTPHYMHFLLGGFKNSLSLTSLRTLLKHIQACYTTLSFTNAPFNIQRNSTLIRDMCRFGIPNLAEDCTITKQVMIGRDLALANYHCNFAASSFLGFVVLMSCLPASPKPCSRFIAFFNIHRLFNSSRGNSD